MQRAAAAPGGPRPRIRSGAMRASVANVPAFDYDGFAIEDIRKALLHMRDLGQALYDLRHELDGIEDAEVRTEVERILAERDDLEDDFVEIGLGHLEGRAGFLQHLHVLGPLSAEQEQRAAEFREDFDARLGELRREAAAIQDQWQRARRAYYRT